MNYDIIEGLSQKELEKIYIDSIEENNFLSVCSSRYSRLTGEKCWKYCRDSIERCKAEWGNYNINSYYYIGYCNMDTVEAYGFSQTCTDVGFPSVDNFMR